MEEINVYALILGSDPHYQEWADSYDQETLDQMEREYASQHQPKRENTQR